MTTRARQREDTRNRIIAAAVRTFAERGFRAASTREIAARARVNQGLITYHFRSKQDLWKAAMDRIFALLRALFAPAVRRPGPDREADRGRDRAREVVRRYVRFAAAHPELFRLMVEEGKHADARMRWLVDTHLKVLYADFARLVATHTPEADRALLPHTYYALAGAGSLIFAVSPECRRLTGLDPLDERTVEAHAEFLARVLVP
jgi:TetR/AcrR family transcriptional regulator